MKSVAVEPDDLATIRTLRLDLALQLARYVANSGKSQAATARLLGVPQPTLSKIIHGQIASMSLELMLRIATRAQLQLVMLTGKKPPEAGFYVNRTSYSGRTQRSVLADHAREELSARAEQLSPEQRLDAQLRHCELLAQLQRGASVSQSGFADDRPQRKRKARTRRP